MLRSQKIPLFLAWLLALASTLGSLYFSQIMGLAPCELCWFQRIFMYPLVLVLGLMLVWGKFSDLKYAFSLSFLGLLIAFYHNFLIWQTKATGIIPYCAPNSVSCVAPTIDWLGFITIPFLSLVSFLLINFCLLIPCFFQRWSFLSLTPKVEN